MLLTKLTRASLVLALLSFASEVSATPVAIPAGQVTSIEVTYLPAVLRFFIATGDTTCPAGVALSYGDANNADKVKGAYAAALAALLSGKTVTAIYDTTNVGSQGAGTCVLTYLYVNR